MLKHVETEVPGFKKQLRERTFHSSDTTCGTEARNLSEALLADFLIGFVEACELKAQEWDGKLADDPKSLKLDMFFFFFFTC